ncbi:MAG: hypothetical protein PHI73_02275 [Patescibacteria group bacterium]|nr:hypothetical protein [Patescibacteria group bacterium]
MSQTEAKPVATSSQSLFWFLKKLTEQIFISSLVTYLGLLLLDKIFENFVSNYFDLSILLVVTLISGLLTSLLRDDLKNH